jgi:hypothetical protein
MELAEAPISTWLSGLAGFSNTSRPLEDSLAKEIRRRRLLKMRLRQLD